MRTGGVSLVVAVRIILVEWKVHSFGLVFDALGNMTSPPNSCGFVM